jgi:uncharacterized protein (DUF58 family)
VRDSGIQNDGDATLVLGGKFPHGMSEKEMTERFERSVNYTASLIAHFITERVEVRLALGHEMGRYGTGQEHLYRCLRRLALVSLGPDEARGATETARAEETAHAAEDAPESHIADGNFAILLTTAAPGSIPANVWRSSYVKYF